MGAFQVTVLPSGRVFHVDPGETILTAAIRQGIGLSYGCKDGACGSCKSKKLDGQVVHGPHESKALSAGEEAASYVLVCSALPQSDVVLESCLAEECAFPIKKMPARVISLEKKSHDVIVLRLQLPSNDTMDYYAGQYIQFILRDGARRSYSMANSPHTNGESSSDTSPGATVGMELHIRHMPGGKFTDHVFHAMKAKEILRVEGPYGSFYLREDSSKPIVLLASGTGFAPIKAIIERMQFKGIDRRAILYWGGRRPADLYLDEWVRAKLAEMPNLRYVPVLSNALQEDNWTGRTGFVHQAVLQDLPDLSGYQVYACGAPIVVESARTDYCKEAGMPVEEFFSDSFTTEADKHGARGSPVPS